MPDQYTEERRHTRLTAGEKCLIAIPFFILLFFLWFMGVTGLIGIERTYHRTKIPSGIEGCSVWLGSTLEEVYSIMGEPDHISGEHYDMLDTNQGSVSYDDQTLWGRNASIYLRFDRNLDRENTRVISISTYFRFSEEEECDRAAQEIQEHFRGTFADRREFSESLRYAPIPTWFENDWVSEYKMSTSNLAVTVIQHPSGIYIETMFSSAYAGPAANKTANETRSFQNIAGILIILTVLLLIAVFLAGFGQEDPEK